MDKEKYNKIIDKVYSKYIIKNNKKGKPYKSRESFKIKIEINSKFAKKWGIIIKEDYDLVPDIAHLGDVTIIVPIRKNKWVVTYKKKIIEIYG